MDNGYILFYDSGVGGLTTLKQTMDRLPKEKFLYFADDENCPYGNKSKEEIERLVNDNLKRLLKLYNIKVVVFACNTVTTCCVKHLRAAYNLEFVGIEPAVLPAIRESKTKEVLVIATKATIAQEKYKRLIERTAGKVYSLGLEGLAQDVEREFIRGKIFDKDKYVKEIKSVLKENPKIDGMVLGCTHYSFMKEYFEKALNIKTFDGNLGVAKRIEELLKQGDKECEFNSGGIEIILSSGREGDKMAYKRLLKSML